MREIMGGRISRAAFSAGTAQTVGSSVSRADVDPAKRFIEQHHRSTLAGARARKGTACADTESSPIWRSRKGQRSQPAPGSSRTALWSLGGDAQQVHTRLAALIPLLPTFHREFQSTLSIWGT